VVEVDNRVMKKTTKITKIYEETKNGVVETVTTKTVIEYKKKEEKEEKSKSQKIKKFDVLSISSSASSFDSTRLMKIKEDSNENSECFSDNEEINFDGKNQFSDYLEERNILADIGKNEKVEKNKVKRMNFREIFSIEKFNKNKNFQSVKISRDVSPLYPRVTKFSEFENKNR